MDRLGVPLNLRQQRVGQSEGSLTLDVYTHVVSEDDVRFAERLGISGSQFLVSNAPIGCHVKLRTDYAYLACGRILSLCIPKTPSDLKMQRFRSFVRSWWLPR